MQHSKVTFHVKHACIPSISSLLWLIHIYYMEESVLLGTKPLVDSIGHFIRDPSGVFPYVTFVSVVSYIVFATRT